MKSLHLTLQKQAVLIGDQVLVRSDRQELVVFAGKPGTVVAVFRVPRGSCLVRLDAEHGMPEVFVYQVEISAPLDR